MDRSGILTGGRVLRGDARGLRAERLEVLVQDGRIAALLPPGEAGPPGAERIAADDRLVIPGLVNAHTHGHGALGRGAVGDRVVLETFLGAAGAINGGRGLEDKRLTARLSAAELIRRGCTACYDLFVELPGPTPEGLDAVAEAYAEAGLRAVVAPMMADRTLWQALPGLLEALPGPLRARAADIATPPFADSLAACRAMLRDWRQDRALVRPALAPTIPLHCSDDFLAGCRDLAAEHDIGLQTHLGETKTQAVVGLARYGRTLTAHLQALGLLGPRFSAAHGIWLDEEDIARLADAGIAGVAHNPMSNLRIGSGVAPARRLLERGVTLGIGTDASNTSDGQNMFEAMRLAAFLSRLAGADPEGCLGAEEAFVAATTGSARILGFERVGRIEPGWAADLVLLDLAATPYVPLRDPLRQMVFAENAAAVTDVMIAGRMVLRDRVLLTLDEAQLRREATAAAARLDALNAGAQDFAEAVSRHIACFCIGQQALPPRLPRRLDQNGPSGR